MDVPKLVLIPIIAGMATQIIKFLIQVVRGELRWSALREYGGMPSAHTAFVVSLDTVIWRQEGWTSPAFAVAVIFSILIIRDAIGLRQYLSQHGRVLNMLIKDLPDEMETKYPTKLVERMGHTPLQAFVGGCVGLVVALSLWALIPATW
jgi:acid phosphatase family membrane protein YuiD